MNTVWNNIQLREELLRALSRDKFTNYNNGWIIMERINLQQNDTWVTSVIDKMKLSFLGVEKKKGKLTRYVKNRNLKQKTNKQSNQGKRDI